MKSSKSKRYKALMIDVDGTLIPNLEDGMPSLKVRNAIKKARTRVHIGVATSRPYFKMRPIFQALRLSGPSIISSGAQIIDVTSQKVLIEHSLDKKTVKELVSILKILSSDFFFFDGTKDIPYSGQGSKIHKKILQVFSFGISPQKADEIVERVSSVPTIAVHKVPSWRLGKVGVVITHIQATKQHGILEVAKILKIDTHEIIGVGDGYNDFPLLMACGLKVAMGNAVPELKAIADYIAPTVDEDGVAHVIEKFILN